jgi:hypothetical protein
MLAYGRRAGGDNGSALIELALIVALLGTPLALGTSEMGSVVYDSIEISEAANAGAWYGMQSSTFAADTAGITTAAQAEASDFGTKLTVTSSTFYACSLAVGGTRYAGANALANATSGCTGTTNHPLQFVQVNTSATVTPLVNCPGLAKIFTLGGLSVMEVEQ